MSCSSRAPSVPASELSDPVPLGAGPNSVMRKDSSTVSGSIPMLPHTEKEGGAHGLPGAHVLHQCPKQEGIPGAQAAIPAHLF